MRKKYEKTQFEVTKTHNSKELLQGLRAQYPDVRFIYQDERTETQPDDSVRIISANILVVSDEKQELDIRGIRAVISSHVPSKTEREVREEEEASRIRELLSQEPFKTIVKRVKALEDTVEALSKQ